MDDPRPHHDAAPGVVGTGGAALRVAYDHTIFTLQRYGGISRYFAEIIPRVARADGAEVCLFMGLYINQYSVGKHRADYRAFWGVRRPAIRKTHTVAQRVGDGMFARFARRCAPRVYHATGYTQLAPATPAARVVTVHDFIFERTRGDPTAPPIQAAMRRADGLICVSENTKRDLMDLLGIPERKIRVVYHGNSLHAPGTGRAPLDGAYLLFVGPRHEYKNFRTLLRAYAASSRLRADVRLACFGGGPFTPAEMGEAVRLGVAERLVHLGGGSDQALADAYAHATALVYPSLYEGFGLPLLEAMSQGCPVISSNTSSMPEVGGDAVIYFDPRGVEELTHKLEQFVGDESLRARLREAGRERQRVFTWERCARETLEFYRDLAG